MSETSLDMLVAEVDQSLAEADALKYGDYRLLLAVAQKAARHAQTLGDFRRYAQALTHQAWAHCNLGQLELSLTCALETLALARSYGFVDIEGRVVGVIGASFFQCGIRQEATYLYEHQLALGEQLHSSEIQAMALNDLAVVRMEANEPERAIELLLRALVLMPPDIHQGHDLALVHLNLSIACINAGRFDEAEEYARQVPIQVIDAPRLVSDVYLCLASIGLGRGDLQEAHRQLAAARACVDAAVPPFYSDNVDQFAAELLVHEGRLQEAAQVWEHMYEMAVQRQALDFAVTNLNHVKDMYERLHDTTGLISAYKRLAEDIPNLQKQGSKLRFAVLRGVFAMDKATLQAELQLTRQKNAILERLSHEFRTPLAIIQSTTQIIEQYGEELPLEQRQARLQRITAQVQWMTVMLENILELLQLDEGSRTAIETAPFRLPDLAQAALLELPRYRLSTSRIRIQTQADVGTVHGAQALLKLVLVHLLTNALKFSQHEVVLELSVDGNLLVMRVVDRGIGIREAERQIIFKPLERGSNLDEVSGAGLGLAIVEGLVAQMHGTIELESIEGKGTTVTVRIPLATVEANQ